MEYVVFLDFIFVSITVQLIFQQRVTFYKSFDRALHNLRALGKVYNINEKTNNYSCQLLSFWKVAVVA